MMQIIRKQINGCNVVFAPQADATSTTVQVLVHAGSIYETKETNGISHFLEHMFFKGGKKYPTPLSVAMTLDACGGECNAFTWDEYAGYYVKCAPWYVQTAVDVLGDMLVHAAFPKEEMEREKQVVVQEIKMYEDMPTHLVMEKWQQRYYGDTSRGWSTLWPEENVMRFTQADLFAHKNALYTKDNLLIIVAGAIPSMEDLERWIGEAFGELGATRSYSAPQFVHHLPTDKQDCRKKGTEQRHLVMSMPGVSMTDPLKYACSLLGVMLGGNMSSRLFQEIREKRGLCYYIHASHHAQVPTGCFMIRAGLEVGRWDEALVAIHQQLDAYAAGAWAVHEKDVALWNITGTTQIGIETSDSMADFVGKQLLLLDGYKTLEEILTAYQNVTDADLKQAAQLLRAEMRYTYWIE
jgi:predicted Zn-dependent peptidase